MALAYELWGELKIDNKQFKSELKQSEAALKHMEKQMGGTEGKTIGLGAAMGALAAGAVAVLGSKLVQGTRYLIDYNIKLDAVRNRLTAVTGSTAAMGKAWTELNNIANVSVGVTREFARETFTQLKGLGQSEAAIYSLIPALGKLNAAFEIPDMKQFVQNLNQIFLQGFERTDIKEAIGRVPIFEELLTTAFGTADGDKLRKLKDAGQLTMDQFLSGISGAIQSNPKVGKIQESIGLQLSKTSEKLTEAFAPIADSMFKPLLASAATLGAELAAKIEAQKGDFEGIGQVIGETIGKGLSDATQGIFLSFWQTAKQEQKTGSDQFVKDWESLGLGTAIANKFFADATNALRSLSPTLFGTIKGIAEDAFGVKFETPSVAAIGRTFAALGSSIMARMESIRAGLATSAGQWFQALTSPFTTLPQWFHNMGVRIGQGLANGIEAGKAAVKTKINELAAMVAQSPMLTWMIRSPSKLFHYYGEMITKGLANGIEAGTPGAVNAAGQLADKIIAQLDPENFKKRSAKDIFKAFTESLANEIKLIRDQMVEVGIIVEQKVSFLQRLDALIADNRLSAKLRTDIEALKEYAQAWLKVKEAMPGVGLDTSDGSGIAGAPGGGAGGFPGQELPAPSPSKPLFPPPPIDKWAVFWDMMRTRLSDFGKSLPSFRQQMVDTFEGSLYRIGDIFGNAVREWDGTIGGFFKSIASGFADMAKEIIAQLVQMLIYKAIFKLLGAFAGGDTSAGISDAELGFSKGGYTGDGGRNKVAGVVHGEEYVIPADRVKQFGRSFFDAIRAGVNPMGSMAAEGGGNSSTTNFSPTINFYGTSDAKGVRQAGQAVMQQALQQLRQGERRNR